MKSFSNRRFNIAEVPWPPVAGGIAVIIAVTVLIMVSRVHNSHERLISLESRVAAIQGTAKAEGDLRAFPLGSVCTASVDDAFKRQLTNALSGSGMKIDVLDIAERGRVGEARPLMSYALSLKATGTYEQAMETVQEMAGYKPRIYVDIFSLRNKTDSVEMLAEGRIFCRWKS